MIPELIIQQWRHNAKWQTLAQIEQDLVISRAIVELYKDPHIKDSLVFRGGTALNKLYIKPQARYSEDIDFVQQRSEPIGKTIDTIRGVFRPWLGNPVWKVTERSAKIVYKYEAINKLPAKLKIEINTTEHLQILPLQTQIFKVESDWFKGFSEVVTYSIDELMATKLRALYQRRKGRDLFDLWYVVKEGLINMHNVLDIFGKYCANDGLHISKTEFLKNLNLKKSHPDFHVDMNALLPEELKWDFEEAYQFVIENIIAKLP